jgi:DNA-binding transcriptional MerR regulator
MAEYKIKDLEILTGIKAHTLRIWEKRYGLVSPERTDTLIRTYTNNELSVLLNVAMLNKSGIKISKIATMNSAQISDKVWELNSAPSSDYSTEKLILALLELNEFLFKETLQKLIDEVGLEKTFSDTLVPFLGRIGVMWLVKTINTTQEHFISNLIRQKVISEIDKLPLPKSTDAPIMLFLPEHEWHELGLLFYQYVLRSKGIPTIYIGQSLPYDSLIECIEQINPKALVTSLLTAVDKKFITSYFKQLKKESKDIPIYGGGYQINMHIEILKNEVIEIKEISDIHTKIK